MISRLLVLSLLVAPAPLRADAVGEPERIVAAVENYRSGGTARVLVESDSILYPFGASQPLVRCSPLRACDVELEAGEVVHGVALGDTERWLASQLFSGAPDALIPHVIVKPRERGLSTNMIVTTTRRTYHLSLVSPPAEEGRTEEPYLRRVRFYYPAQLVEQWSSAAKLEAKENDRRDASAVASLSGALDPASLDFAYSLGGSRRARFRPTTVFDDGLHTYIQLPASIASGDVPAFIARTSAGEDLLLNYRMSGAWIIVDGLFEAAELTLGVGRKRQSVTIRNLGFAEAR